jgi:hypothetical protein
VTADLDTFLATPYAELTDRIITSARLRGPGRAAGRR